MSGTALETLYTKDRLSRVRLHYDDCSENPLDWRGEPYLIIWIDRFHRFETESSSKDHPLIGENQLDDIWQHAYDQREFVQNLRKHCKRNSLRLDTVVPFYDGGEQRLVISPIGEHGELLLNLDAYRDWLDGSVYSLDLERLERWTSTTGETRDMWTLKDGIAGVYLNDNYTVADAASEHFGIEVA